MPKPKNELKELAEEFGGKIPADLKKALRPVLRQTAQPALRAVKDKASWSSRVPAATRLQVSLAGKRPGVAIVVDRKKAPHARNWEHDGRAGRTRWPVFGNREVWAQAPSRPFLTPAATPWQERTQVSIGEIVDQVAREHGFR